MTYAETARAEKIDEITATITRTEAVTELANALHRLGAPAKIWVPEDAFLALTDHGSEDLPPHLEALTASERDEFGWQVLEGKLLRNALTYCTESEWYSLREEAAEVAEDWKENA